MKSVIYFCLLIGTLALPEAVQARTTLPDSLTLRHFLQQGKWRTQMRSFFMLTDNRPGLSDSYALAVGGAASYQTASFKGFQLGFTGSFTYNLWSSNLSQPDPLTGQFNRYEIGLFDIEDPDQPFIGRVDEMYVRYNWKKSKIVWGKQMLNTPWVNPQDGRMRPNFQDGLYLDFQELKHFKIELAWLYRFLVRSTESWLSIAQSIGQYPNGVTPDGVRADYRNNLRSGGLGIAGISYFPSARLQVQFWNYYAANISNTMFWQGEWQLPLGIAQQNHWLGGVQFHYQTAIGEGGSANPEFSYMPSGQRNHAISARTGWKRGANLFTINYTRIAAGGRFLFPREWGRDPFYTFLPRERNEGYGDTHGVMTQLSHQFRKIRLKAEVGYGHYYLPSPLDNKLNKYGVPSYRQLNINLIHQFGGRLKGMQGQFLWVHKGQLGSVYDNPRFEFNKVNMNLYNLVVNYNF
jgi:hypothetical protein